MSDAAVNDLLTNAVTQGSEIVAPPPQVMEGELIQPVTDEATEILNRAWVVSRHMRCVQIAMGEVEVVENSEVIDENGRKTRTTIRKTSHDPVAAHQHLKSLTAELNRRDANLALAANDDNPATMRVVDPAKLVEHFTVMRAPKDKAN